MADIYVGMAVLAILSVAAFTLALRLARSVPRSSCDGLAAALFAGLLLYIATLWDQPRLARLLPFSNLIVLGNWFPIATSFLAGLVWKRFPGGTLRAYGLMTLLLTVGFYSVLHPLRGRTPECDDEWLGNVCLQTNLFTCSPASAASLLKAHGITTTEQEMAELCLTRRGTTWTGLYRGLKKKTAGTGWDVEVFDCTLPELRRRTAEGPVILSVELEEGGPANDVYVRECGWIPGQPHSVVLYKFLGEDAVVGDPSQGREIWPRKDLEVLWHGQGLRLVPRTMLAGL